MARGLLPPVFAKYAKTKAGLNKQRAFALAKCTLKNSRLGCCWNKKRDGLMRLQTLFDAACNPTVSCLPIRRVHEDALAIPRQRRAVLRWAIEHSRFRWIIQLGTRIKIDATHQFAKRFQKICGGEHGLTSVMLRSSSFGVVKPMCGHAHPHPLRRARLGRGTVASMAV